MTFEQYWMILVRRWPLVLLCLALMGAGSLVASLFMTPVYSSSVLVQVAIHSGTDNQSDINDLLASNQLVQTESQLAVSNPIVQEVVSHHAGLTAAQLSKMVSSSVKLNTQLFELTVMDTDAHRGANLANELAQTFIRQQERARQQENQASQQQLQQEITATLRQITLVKRQGASTNSLQAASSAEQLTTLEQHYNQWQSALAQLELSEAQRSNFLLIVQPAQVATEPVQPDIMLNTAAGLLLGLLCGFGLILFLSQVDQRVYSCEELQQLWSWPVLALIWPARPHQSLLQPAANEANGEAYRILRSSIGFAGVDKPLRHLMVTSVLPREGKSTVAANLAIFMAMAGKSTLLIDADLLCPTLHEMFDLPPDKPGLSNAILACGMPDFQAQPQRVYHTVVDARSISLDPYIHPSGIPNLRVMSSGPLPPNPAELLESRAMQRFFQTLDSHGADVIIFDSSPLSGLSESIVLSAKVDGTIVVTDLKLAHKAQLREARSRLLQAGSRVVGCVINKYPRRGSYLPYSLYARYRSSEQLRPGKPMDARVVRQRHPVSTR
ncbi:polysaccharide biosynthesis tyrosine autokinase [Dictyobacter kobayashii]|uniref:Polysaccharide chain length determinant N-terminal domain-containing protein n=1 Tax=Dictyobacter kobayashii TaxID=2014872 RepID=A0A402APV7_9CHLR|nr:polysaccharide biosynthesis tyrosine autokinase [Dictyobacter kobayashii]GCE21020.1 hypothetical protein KDK_48200 [Dictyobacter kobayashii]